MVPIIFRIEQVLDCASHELGDVSRCKLLHHPFVWRREGGVNYKNFTVTFLALSAQINIANISLRLVWRIRNATGCNSDAQLDVIKNRN